MHGSPVAFRVRRFTGNEDRIIDGPREFFHRGQRTRGYPRIRAKGEPVGAPVVEVAGAQLFADDVGIGLEDCRAGSDRSFEWLAGIEETLRFRSAGPGGEKRRLTRVLRPPGGERLTVSVHEPDALQFIAIFPKTPAKAKRDPERLPRLDPR